MKKGRVLSLPFAKETRKLPRGCDDFVMALGRALRSQTSKESPGYRDMGRNHSRDEGFVDVQPEAEDSPDESSPRKKNGRKQHGTLALKRYPTKRSRPHEPGERHVANVRVDKFRNRSPTHGRTRSPARAEGLAACGCRAARDATPASAERLAAAGEGRARPKDAQPVMQPAPPFTKAAPPKKQDEPPRSRTRRP
ncbi:hypothetical protein PHYSODRAFT_320800 [Phytophthora sojae]|uniref:Uncharacterized protein n=1 Tax=Phytophthora sojae (strain P6497) TaxID=1094619 RepID=G4YET7_PHYSP|nr:hypothetical protein PHYSODRAFT_320800 [Phytophthora sojae]EGZ26931.1 hypothetical protein PHYSODRAFT_320800 [Phytophthora sojae]|eukprot:XP_009514206.1 hypothetical protein PHYSODRAFT_320800 [Phytophthora sojae]